MANDTLILEVNQLDTKLSQDIALDARSDKKHKGFDNASMIWYIEAWSKIRIIAHGGGWRTYHQFLDKRTLKAPKDTKSTYAKQAVKALSPYIDSIAKGREDDSLFKAVDDAMMDFFYDYWDRILGMKGDSVPGKDFTQKVKQWTNQNPDVAMKTPIFDDELALTRGD